MVNELQFLRELHFIEAIRTLRFLLPCCELQFLRELHFIEAPIHSVIFSIRVLVAVPSGAALY